MSAALVPTMPGQSRAVKVRAAVPEKFIQLVDARFAAIQWRREVLRGNRETPLGVRNRESLDKHIGSQQQPPVDGATIRRWERLFKAGGLTALTPVLRKDKGKSRFFEEHLKAAARAQQLYLREGNGNRLQVHDILCQDWPSLGCNGPCPLRKRKLDKNCRPPDADTVNRYLAALPRPLVTLAHQGRQAYVGQCSPFILRGPVPVMDWAISDHRRFDDLVRNTLFDEQPAEALYRPWKTLLLDWGSRKIVGYCFAPTPSSRTINSSLRMAFQQFGFWKNLYWDNGKDYASARAQLEEINLSPELQGLLQQRQIGITSALPKHPRSKPIEAHFTRWSKRFDPMWRPAYVGRKPGLCPEDCRDGQKDHGDYLSGKRDSTPMPTDAEFFRGAIQWIEEYNDTPLDGLDHRSPNEVFDEQHPPAARPDPNDAGFRRALDLLLCERVTRTVLQGGCVEMDRMRYEPADTASLMRLDPLQGRKIVILRDPYNLADAVAVEAETHYFLGELQVQQFVAQCPNGHITRDQIKAGMRKARSLHRAYSEYLGLLGAIAQAHDWKSPRQALLARAQLRATGTNGLADAVPGAVAPRARQLPPAVPQSPEDFAESFGDGKD